MSVWQPWSLGSGDYVDRRTLVDSEHDPIEDLRLRTQEEQDAILAQLAPQEATLIRHLLMGKTLRDIAQQSGTPLPSLRALYQHAEDALRGLDGK